MDKLKFKQQLTLPEEALGMYVKQFKRGKGKGVCIHYIKFTTNSHLSQMNSSTTCITMVIAIHLLFHAHRPILKSCLKIQISLYIQFMNTAVAPLLWQY